jgi:hypothetical protein
MDLPGNRGSTSRRDKYARGICEFPGGAQSDAADRLAAELAAIAVRLATAEICEQIAGKAA